MQKLRQKCPQNPHLPFVDCGFCGFFPCFCCLANVFQQPAKQWGFCSTHIVLWALAGHSRISSISARLLDDDNEVFFSAASLWEVAIKSGIGKLDANLIELRAAARASGFQELAILGSHIEALALLPDLHRDPFDRLLVAQAIAEPMQLLTADRTVALYGAHVELI